MKTSSMARVGISARRILRNALATEVSSDIKENEVSWGLWLWKSTLNVYLESKYASV